MSKMSRVSMTNGELYMIQLTPDEIKDTIGGTETGLKKFDLKSGDKVYLQVAHIVSIESTGETTTLTDSFSTDHVKTSESPKSENDKEEKANQNLESAKAFKKDLEGNME